MPNFSKSKKGQTSEKKQKKTELSLLIVWIALG